MWLIASSLPGLNLSPVTRYVSSLIIALAGVWVSVSGVMAFRKAHTTVNPRQPGKTSQLVTSGIYQLTRNPMYVGFSCWLIAWSLFLDSLYALALVVAFVFFIDRFQIRPEEKILESAFGDEFRAYKNNVRRWL